MQSSSVTLKKKIFIETSVLVAASNHITLPEGEQIEDDFYNESIDLLSIITKYFESRIGITTKTVENEAKKVLMDVITSTLEQNAPAQAQSFEAKSFHWDRCMARMDHHLSYLSIEPTPKELTDRMDQEIRTMYRELTARRKLSWQLRKEAEVEIEAETIRKPSALHAHPQDIQRYKEEMIQTRYEHKLRENLQLVRLARNPASKNDRQILAEAVLIFRHYSTSDPKFQLFLASCDSNNFCPYFSLEYGRSSPVSDEIQNKFKIKCDRPGVLAKMLREELEPPPVEEYQADEGEKDEEESEDGNNDETQAEEANKGGGDSDKPPYLS